MPTTPQDKRPSLAKKQTRASKKAEDDALDDGLKITLDGETYQIRVGDMTALDARALRQQTGYSFPNLMAAVGGDGVDIDLIAAVLWLSRYVGGERDLTYEAVAAEVGYDTLDRIEIVDAPAEDGEDAAGEA